MFAQQLPAVLQELVALERLNPKLVARELRPIIESMRSRVKVCYRCQGETIGRREPKRSQRQFCGRECSSAQAHEDFLIRESARESARGAAQDAKARERRRTPHGHLMHGRLRSRKGGALRRARAAFVGPIDFVALYKRDGGRCWICWRTLPFQLVHFDHVVPLARGGAHSEENLRVACQSCNERKSDNLPTPDLIARIRDVAQARAEKISAPDEPQQAAPAQHVDKL